MSLPKETEVARLLREMNERDALIKALNANDQLKGLRTSLNSIQTQMDNLKLPEFQEAAKKIQDVHHLQAIEVAKRLQEPALKAAEVAKRLQGPALRAPEMAKRLPSVTGPTASAQPQIRSAETPVRTVADLGSMIRKARKAMKLNQADFASHAGVGRRFISELEGGKGSLEFDKVIACAIAAGIDVSARGRKS